MIRTTSRRDRRYLHNNLIKKVLVLLRNYMHQFGYLLIHTSISSSLNHKIRSFEGYSSYFRSESLRISTEKLIEYE